MINIDFIMDYEIESLEQITGLDRDGVIADYLLFCECAELEVNFESWTEYKDETENQF